MINELLPDSVRLSDSLGVAHCRQCASYKNEYSPIPGESWNRCTAKKMTDGSNEYCSRNKNNACPDFKRTLNPLRRWSRHGKWYQTYM